MTMAKRLIFPNRNIARQLQLGAGDLPGACHALWMSESAMNFPGPQTAII
jgi:hypothetical protein